MSQIDQISKALEQKNPAKTRNSNRPDFGLSPTIINVEDYPECDNPDQAKKLPESFFSPRLKKNRREVNPVSQSTEKFSEQKGKKNNFNDFLSKMEQYQKSKNEKIINLQAVKKVQEEVKLNNIPKIKMSEMSKKILEEKKKRDSEPEKKFAYSPAPNKDLQPKPHSSSTKDLKSRPLLELQTLESISNKSEAVKEKPVLGQNDKVLASKLVKELNAAADEVNGGKFSLKMKDAKEILKKMAFLEENANADKLFMKMWSITGAEGSGEITLDNLRTFILAVMNLYLQSTGHNDPTGPFGKIVQGKLYLNPEEVGKIHKFFNVFFENRNNSIKKTEKKIESIKKEEIPRPETKPKIERTNSDKFLTPSTVNEPKKSHIIKITEIKQEKIQTKAKPEPEPQKQDPPAVRIKDTHLSKIQSNAVPKNTEKMVKVQSVKSLAQAEREACMTPKSRRMENVNTSFRSARSKSRSKISQSSARSSLSEAEWVGIVSDKISDPSILLKAQDLLGAFSLKKTEAKEEKKQENDGNSSKLLYKKNTGFKGPGNKGIDEDLRRAQNILKSGSRSPGKSDDIIVEVSMPDGTQKTLVVPLHSNHKTVVQKFVKENNLTSEMGSVLLSSISNS